MLLLLTGDVQTGKTRWLEKLIVELGGHGVVSYGVAAPGVWVKSDGPYANDQGLEKLGINNVLLPMRTVITFAQRRDIAQYHGTFSESSQSAKAGLSWEISNESLQAVNQHFDAITSEPPAGPALLVVDELGQLELLREEGLTSAVKLLDAGPTQSFPHALAVVRRDLLPRAEERFEGSWKETVTINPTDEGLQKALAVFRA